MFVVSQGSKDRMKLYRDVLAVYKKLIATGLAEYSLPEETVVIKNSNEQNKNRAPLIVIERGDMQYEPKSLMFNEKTDYNVNTKLFESNTIHVIEYPIEFTCYGNTYLETEMLGTLCMDSILTAGLSIVKSMNPHIFGAEFVGWGKSGLTEGSDSSLMSCSVLGKVFLRVDGYYSIIK